MKRWSHIHDHTQSAKLKLFFGPHALKYISTLIPPFLEVILRNKHGDFGNVPP